MRLYDRTTQTTFELATYADKDEDGDFQYRLELYALPLSMGPPVFTAGKIRHDTFDEGCYYADLDSLAFFDVPQKGFEHYHDWEFESLDTALKALVKHSGRFRKVSP